MCLMSEKFVIAQGTDASTLDPFAHSETTTSNILLQVYDSLVKRNEDMEIVPHLAVEWEQKSSKELVFHLRQDAVFHHGDQLTAEDVKFSIERMVDPANEERFPPSGRFNSMTSVDILDKYTVKVNFNRPDPNILAQLAGLMIISKGYFESIGEERFSKEPSGTGPFKFKQWDREAGKVYLERNVDYWGGKADIEVLEFHAVPHGSDRIAGLIEGNIHLTANFPPSEQENVQQYEHLTVAGTPSVGVIYMGINTNHEILKNKTLRHAIAHGIDVNKFIDEELLGCGYPLNGPVYPQAFGVDQDQKPIEYNPEKAKELLKEAGYENGVKVKLEVPDGRFTQDKEIAWSIAEQLKEIGIELEVDVQPWGPFISRFRDHKYDQMYYVGWGNFTFDPDEVYRNAFIHPKPWNPTHFHHERLAEVATEASLSLDQDKRKTLYSEALSIFRDELPWIPLFQQFDLYGLNSAWNFKARMDEFIYAFDITKSKTE